MRSSGRFGDGVALGLVVGGSGKPEQGARNEASREVHFERRYVVEKSDWVLTRTQGC
jgi:hypothetical protein